MDINFGQSADVDYSPHGPCVFKKKQRIKIDYTHLASESARKKNRDKIIQTWRGTFPFLFCLIVCLISFYCHLSPVKRLRIIFVCLLLVLLLAAPLAIGKSTGSQKRTSTRTLEHTHTNKYKPKFIRSALIPVDISE